MSEELGKNTKRRIFLMYLSSLLFSLLILSKVIHIQFVEGDELRKKSEQHNVKLRTVEAARGDILASDGSLLATSVPFYDIRLDLCTPALTDDVFYSNIDSLAYCLEKSGLMKKESKNSIKDMLLRARKRGDRYFSLVKGLRYDEVQLLKGFPIFRLGRYKGGFIVELNNKKRELPFRLLAARTIGYERNGIKVGLEGAYNSVLEGVSGKLMMRRISGNIWMPLTDENQIDPRDGSDILTTIDIHIQDVAENALMNQLIENDADHGCVVLMEVSTGDIKAIANLSRVEQGRYNELYNHAIGKSTEPGSTFKLMSIICALEDRLVDITDSIATGNGTVRYYGHELNDAKPGGYGTITVKQAFEYSSNVAISKIINQGYGKDPAKFINRLYEMGLGSILGIEISGEGKPLIKRPSDSDWSGITLPWMSIGYEVQLTPLQILTFYNAVANNGKMMKPRFVKEIQRSGKRIKTIEPVVLNKQICSNATIKKVQSLLEGVVENGTARNLRDFHIKVAGKTGTAQIANEKYGYKYKEKVSYQASFAGYFPAENPQYSCIVVVNAPSRNVYYANLVAGPIFKEIAEKVLSTRLDMHVAFDAEVNEQIRFPRIMNGSRTQLNKVLKTLEMEVEYEDGIGEYMDPYVRDGKLKMRAFNVDGKLVPNVIGMSLKDAVALLENLGLRVSSNGFGEIVSQSIKPGDKITQGERIHLSLLKK